MVSLVLLVGYECVLEFDLGWATSKASAFPTVLSLNPLSNRSGSGRLEALGIFSLEFTSFCLLNPGECEC